MSDSERIKGQGVKRLIGFFAFLPFVLLASYPVYGGGGASFLKLGVGARALGLGSAYTAIANDVTALYWNPAGLSQLKKKEVGAMHAELFADTRLNFVAYALPVRASGKHPSPSSSPSRGEDRGEGEALVLGVGAVYLSQGKKEGRSAERTQTSDFTSSVLAVSLGAGKAVFGNASLGVT